MPILKYGDKLIFFIHIPKTGGSSIEHYMSSKGAVAFLSERRSPPGMSVTAQHIHAEIHEDLFPPEFFDESFSVVRDPIERMISEYRWRSEQKKMSQDGGVRYVSFLGRTSLLDFDRWVELVFDLYQSNPFLNDNHIRPQTEFLSKTTKVFRFENGLHPIYDWIDTICGEYRGDRSAHHKKTRSQRPSIKDTTKQSIINFYDADYTFLSGATCDRP